MKKRVLAILLALCLALALVPTAAFAANSDFQVENNVLTKYLGAGGNVNIPADADILVIGKDAFKDNTTVTSVTIPNTVKLIRESAFQGCSRLTNVTMPNSVVMIGSSAFQDCVSLTSVTLPESINIIDRNAFKGCVSLTDAIIYAKSFLANDWVFAESGLQNIHYAGTQGQWEMLRFMQSNPQYYHKPFLDAEKEFGISVPTSAALPAAPTTVSSPSDFTIENGVLKKYIGSAANVVIPDSVFSIENNAFENNNVICSVYIPGSVKEIGNSAFQNCFRLTSVAMANGVAKIGAHSFENCYSLTNLTLPQSVNHICDWAFQSCASLEEVTILSTSFRADRFVFADSALFDINFAGTQGQWDSLDFAGRNQMGAYNNALEKATVHYNTPIPPEPTPPQSGTDPQPSNSPDPTPSNSPDPQPSNTPDPTPSNTPDPTPSKNPDPTPGVKVTGVTVSKTSLTMEPGQTEDLTATVSPAAAENKTVTWSSNAPAVASVSSNGRVTALAAGAAEITAKTADGGFTAVCRVLVKGESKPDAVEVHFPRANVYNDGQFADVPANQWFTNGVRQAFEFGLMNGTSAKHFDPRGDVTIAQAITMAARIHSIYTTGAENFTPSGKWYQVYLDYAFQNGIISYAFYNTDVNKNATRAQFAEIFSNALPDEALEAVNDVTDGAIPDVPMTAIYASHVYKLYRAGILTGGDATGSFSPDSYITRQEAATIVARMAESSNRVSFSLG